MIKLTEGELRKETMDNSSLKGKEVYIKENNGDVIEGFVQKVEEEYLIVAKNGDWDTRETVRFEVINVLDMSEFPYYSESHKRRLRELKKPALEYRFTLSQLNEFLGKYVSINSDGELISGQVSEFYQNKKGYTITITCLNKEIAKVEDYTIRSIEITGNNCNEHKMLERLFELEEELLIDLEKHGKKSPEGSEYNTQDPDELIEKYFEFKLGTSSENLDYDWKQSVLESKEKLKADNASFLEEFRKANEMNAYYQSRKCFINNLFEKTNDVNWTSYGLKQEEGINKALNYLYESGIATMAID